MQPVSSAELTEITNAYRSNPSRALARMIHSCAIDSANTHSEIISDSYSELDEGPVYVDVYLEYVGLYMHLFNRRISEDYGENYIKRFQDAIIRYVIEGASVFFEGPSNQITSEILNQINESENTYSQRKYWMSDKSSKLLHDDDSIFFALVERLCNLFNLDSQDPMAVIKIDAECASAAYIFSHYFKLSEWLKGMAMQLNIANFDSIDLKPDLSLDN